MPDLTYNSNAPCFMESATSSADTNQASVKQLSSHSHGYASSVDTTTPRAVGKILDKATMTFGSGVRAHQHPHRVSAKRTGSLERHVEAREQYGEAQREVGRSTKAKWDVRWRLESGDWRTGGLGFCVRNNNAAACLPAFSRLIAMQTDKDSLIAAGALRLW